MLYEMLHSFGHLVVSCFHRVVSCCMKFNRDQMFSLKKRLYDTTYLLFSGMLYDVVLVWPPSATLLYSVVLSFEEMLYGVI